MFELVIVCAVAKSRFVHFRVVRWEPLAEVLTRVFCFLMESKRRTAEVLENDEKRPRREHTSLLMLLQQVEQHTMPTGTEYHVRHCPFFH